MQTFLTAARKAREAIFWPTPVVIEGTFDSSEFSKQGVLITAESGIHNWLKWWLLGRSFYWVVHSLFLMYCKTYHFVEHSPMGVRNCQTTDRSPDMNALLNNKRLLYCFKAANASIHHHQVLISAMTGNGNTAAVQFRQSECHMSFSRHCARASLVTSVSGIRVFARAPTSRDNVDYFLLFRTNNLLYHFVGAVEGGG